MKLWEKIIRQDEPKYGEVPKMLLLANNTTNNNRITPKARQYDGD